MRPFGLLAAHAEQRRIVEEAEWKACTVETYVEFRSSKFPPYLDEERAINPGLWGKRLAEYLERKLIESGLETNGIHAEGWGWIIQLRHERFPMWIGCGHREDEKDGYLVFVEPSKPTIRNRWLKRIDTTADVAYVCGILDGILASDPEIHDVRWRSSDESSQFS